MHFTREKTLKRFVLLRIFSIFFEDITSLQKVVYEQRFDKIDKAPKNIGGKRISEFDRICKRIYEEDIWAQSLTNSF